VLLRGAPGAAGGFGAGGDPVNRAERRRNRPSKKQRVRARAYTGEGGPMTAERLRALAACPDCGSTVEVYELRPGLHHAEVLHDDGCPAFRQLQQELS
jgi:hypothetical protein